MYVEQIEQILWNACELCWKKEQENPESYARKRYPGLTFKQYVGEAKRYEHLPDHLCEWGTDKEAQEGADYLVQLEEEFGGEGMGDQYWYVFSITNNKTNEVVYVKFDGWYASYDGHNFESDEFNIVEPKMVEVRKWFIKG